MTDRKDVFEGDKTFLPGIDIDLPLSIVQTRTCEQYIDCYSKAVKEAADQGDSQTAAVYCFLQIICTFGLSLDTPATPFMPMWSSPAEGKRSLVPSDLTRNDIDAVRILAKQTSDPALRARLHDVLWETGLLSLRRVVLADQRLQLPSYGSTVPLWRRESPALLFPSALSRADQRRA